MPREKSIVNEASRYYSRPIMAERKENNSVPFYKRCGWKLFGSDCDGRMLFVAAIVAIRNHNPVGLAPLALYRRPEQNVLLTAFGPFEQEAGAISWL